ncbi:G-protein coupled receptor 54-like [Lytechinus variegatus]|uniref:G-protein coupled receptor 54-like n=1 Tax=Lytechinus variegatus TaxID=7654 RepID=UPI001BB1B463|nr:G-protein coupled receptor 54-like [Lytechinus variegatus]XP_041463971.1 G-protein coupled receptor 54-like [Lytechinus variegatus]
MTRMDVAMDYPDTQGFNDSELESFSSIYYYIYNDTKVSSKWNEMMTVLYVTLPILLAVIGIIGNSTVMYIIFKHRDMQTVTNYFLANLAATDVAMLTLCAIPSAIAIIIEIPLSVCKGINYIMFATVQATCLTLTAMTIDRYNLIVHAVKSRKTRTIRKTVITNIFIWAGSFLLQAPVATSSTITEYGKCMTIFATRSGSNAFHIFNTLSMYVLPLTIILVCYVNILVQVWRKATQGTESAQAQERSIRRKRKITRMVFIIVLLFAICWLPTHVIRLWEEFDSGFHIKADNAYFDFANLIAFCLVYASSCVNPFVYAFKTTSFKKHFKKLFASCCHSAQSAMGSVSTFKLSKFTRDDESI